MADARNEKSASYRSNRLRFVLLIPSHVTMVLSVILLLYSRHKFSYVNEIKSCFIKREIIWLEIGVSEL